MKSPTNAKRKKSSKRKRVSSRSPVSTLKSSTQAASSSPSEKHQANSTQYLLSSSAGGNSTLGAYRHAIAAQVTNPFASKIAASTDVDPQPNSKLSELLHRLSSSTNAMTSEAEEILLHLASEFVDQTVELACQISKNRQSHSLASQDIALAIKAQDLSKQKQYKKKLNWNI